MRLVIVSNRLPISLEEQDGKIVAKESVGGLATGLNSYLDSLDQDSQFNEDPLWIGWPGMYLDDPDRFDFSSRIMGKFRICPVNLTDAQMDSFYLGFCNSTLWPLFHYFPSYVEFDESSWDSYVEVNDIFRQVVESVLQPDDVVWVHDYQIMLLPEMIRRNRPDVSIGYFLHIPFPSYEIFRLLPSIWRTRLLQGLLGSDLIGFHTYDYSQHFLRSVSAILGLEHNLGKIMVGDRLAKVDTFPMGIDYNKYAQAAKDERTQTEKEELRQSFGSAKIMLSIDRLDYSKGIANRLQGYEKFLELYPQWHDRVILMLVVVPSRTGVGKYQEMKKQIDELVGAINGRFGKLNWTPIIYQYTTYPLRELTMLYDISDVALVTPLRDGMNLIAKEYIAAKTENKGVLVLSETAGAAIEMGETLIVNANSVLDIAETILRALETPDEEQARVMVLLKDRMERFDVNHWAEDFMNSMLLIKSEQERMESTFINTDAAQDVVRRFKAADRRLLLLDYDGTLVPFHDAPSMACPSDEIRKILSALTSMPNTEVVILSGRNKHNLEHCLADPPVALVAEHGVWIREIGGEWQMIRPLLNDWKDQIRPILDRYSSRVPGTFTEDKDFSMAWHYRQADRNLGAQRARELAETLRVLASNVGIQVLQSPMVVEVRSAGISKAVAAMHFASKQEWDFILALGDAESDEEMFKTLPDHAVTIRVGSDLSHATYNVRNPRAAGVLLKNFTL
ncbi:trehalose 6-phosphate synthase/phosphatase [Desulfonatronum thiosulfatophilum]|uniref:Trehalose 6-phosphate synthase/phosphatase n=1 Tax=Desulfonatronum thiosulfatophilum TaxID=617002 RepID=A0A1G6A2P1_9BACT|nr:bifunctional alpha,alpha-trehalose-phosphate synthase (UDP-forming)/trehalose-phosphatase [Desulfonatronum thiosulfatophilum]SDB02655.1 trehalose 6-phosphate synthase/phosphatase [Desulfonatronum thiosulfatophilum]